RFFFAIISWSKRRAHFCTECLWGGWIAAFSYEHERTAEGNGHTPERNLLKSRYFIEEFIHPTWAYGRRLGFQTQNALRQPNPQLDGEGPMKEIPLFLDF